MERGGAQVGWQWAGVAPRPHPSHPEARDTLWAGAALVSQAGFSLRLWGRQASATERVPPLSIRLWRPPARPPAFSRRLPPSLSSPARSLCWTGALEGGLKSARGNCSARGVRSGASMVSGERQGPGLDSGDGASREVSPSDLGQAAAPHRTRFPSEKWVGVPGCGVRPGVPCSGHRGTEVRDQGPTHTLRWRGRQQVMLLSAIPANTLRTPVLRLGCGRRPWLSSLTSASVSQTNSSGQDPGRRQEETPPVPQVLDDLPQFCGLHHNRTRQDFVRMPT